MDRTLRPQGLLATGLLAAILAAWPAPAAAVIKVETPVSKICDASKAVVVGTVARVNPDNRVVDVKVAATAKGDAGADQFRLQVLAPPELLAKVAPERPVVLFIAKERGGAMALVHLADTWLMAEQIAGASPPAWRTVQVHDARQAFPGRTAALARVVGELKSGKPTILDRVEPNFFRGAVKERAKLTVAKPLFLCAAGFSGTKEPDLVVGTPAGARLFVAAGPGYEDATEKWGLASAAGAWGAVGDVSGDGKPDALIGKTLWVNDGRKFTAAKATLDVPEGARPLAAALLDVTGDKKPDALVLLATGELLVFENPGSPDAPWKPQPPRRLWQEAGALAAAFGDFGDTGRPHAMVVRAGGLVRYALDADGGPPADYERLTGERPGGLFKIPGGPKGARAIAIDVNGDGRPDFLMAADGGDVLLVNRGFGAFLSIADTGIVGPSQGARQVPFQMTPAAAWCAVDLRGDRFEDLLVLTEDGRLFEVANPPPAAAPAP